MDPSEVEQTLRYIKKTEKDEDYIRTVKVPDRRRALLHCEPGSGEARKRSRR